MVLLMEVNKEKYTRMINIHDIRVHRHTQARINSCYLLKLVSCVRYSDLYYVDRSFESYFTCELYMMNYPLTYDLLFNIRLYVELYGICDVSVIATQIKLSPNFKFKSDCLV